MQDFLHMGGVCSAAIESENVVGYATGTTGSDNNFVTIPFNAVGYTTADIQQIKITGDGIGYGTENFSIWEGLPTVADGSSYVLWDPSMDMTATATDFFWGNEMCEPVSFSIAPGQGVVINCGADLGITTSGAVEASPITFTTVSDNNFTGNPFPAAIDIQAIKIEGDGIGYGTENFSIWEGLPTVADGSSYVLWDPSMDMTATATDFFWGNEMCEPVTYSIPAGQGVVINCVAGLKVTINPPYTLGK